MANVQNSNTYYIDTASVSLAQRGVTVLAVILTDTGGSGEFTLGDNDSGASYPTKLHLKVPASSSQTFDLSSAPLFFPSGIRVVTCSNCVATLILKAPGA